MFFYYRKFHAIRKIQLNLLDLKLQYTFCMVMVYEVFFDQVKNILLQAYYDHLGLDTVFNSWWLSFLIENLGDKKL